MAPVDGVGLREKEAALHAKHLSIASAAAAAEQAADEAGKSTGDSRQDSSVIPRWLGQIHASTALYPSYYPKSFASFAGKGTGTYLL